MGKGDKKTKKGKIWKGSYGNSRKRKMKATHVPSDKVDKVEKVEKVEKPVVAAKPKAKKAPKKVAKKKAKPADKE
ncbi:MAG TPA: 30S ribosomal protein THX [Cyclobacteriaceae bacterium]